MQEKNLKTLTGISKLVLLLLMAATVIFIFVNSMLPPEKSQEQSDGIKDVIIEVLPDNSKAESFVEQYIRKVAHFTEYGLLGIELALYLALFERRRAWLMAIAPVLPFFVGFIDESIQIASKRGPSIEDVWIDIGGFVTFYLLSLAVFGAVMLVLYLVKRHKGVKKETNGS